MYNCCVCCRLYCYEITMRTIAIYYRLSVHIYHSASILFYNELLMMSCVLSCQCLLDMLSHDNVKQHYANIFLL